MHSVELPLFTGVAGVALQEEPKVAHVAAQQAAASHEAVFPVHCVEPALATVGGLQAPVQSSHVPNASQHVAASHEA